MLEDEDAVEWGMARAMIRSEWEGKSILDNLQPALPVDALKTSAFINVVQRPVGETARSSSLLRRIVLIGVGVSNGRGCRRSTVQDPRINWRKFAFWFRRQTGRRKSSLALGVERINQVVRRRRDETR